MKSLQKYPTELIEKICNQFANELWDEAITSIGSDRELASAICGFQDAMRNWIINELTASSIVDEIEINKEH